MWTPKGYGDNQGWYKPAAAAPSYVGPGDVVSGAVMWVSAANAYSAAFAAGGTAMADLVDQAGANAITINVLPSGDIDVSAISAWVSAHSVTTIKIKKLYDQTGNGNDFTQATLASMPSLTLLGLNSLPTITFVPNQVMLTPTMNVSVPYSMVAVGKRTGANTTLSYMLAATGTALGIGFDSSVNSTVFKGNGGGANAITDITNSTDGVFHALIGVNNSASSFLTVDGADVSGSITVSTAISATVRLGRDGGGAATLTGQIAEAGIWPSAISARASLNTNIHNRYSF